MLFAVAAAQDLPWVCPPVAAPADAHVYRSAGVGAQAALDPVRALAVAWEAYDCAWVETTGGDSETRFTFERVCDDGSVRITSWSSWHRRSDTSESEYTLSVVVPTGETWTNLLLDTYETTGWDRYDSDGSRSSSSTALATWSGAIDGLPDDAWIEIVAASSDSGGYASASTTVHTPACGWAWDRTLVSTSPAFEESVSTQGHTVAVWSGYDDTCGQEGAYASLDGVRVGAVDPDTWARDLADADGDGWPAGSGDCDDADPARSECLSDTPNDGIDQDCDGADRVEADVDQDGFDSVALGGPDCDDADVDTFPGARDVAGDGVDQDCDGADDLDADGDGYTADGDLREADCDDADAARNPGEQDIPYDGIDQDCTGADDADLDGDGADAREAGGLDCDDHAQLIGPDAYEHPCDGVDQDCDGTDACLSTDTPAETGCGSRAAWLGLLPAGLLARRRRRTA